VIDHDAEGLLVAGAALGDLDPFERAALEPHRVTCASCRALEADLDGVLADLALLPEPIAPPAFLLAGIRRGISGVGGSPAPGTAGDPRTPPAIRPGPGRGTAPVIPISAARTQRPPFVVAVGIAAALALAVAGLGVRSVSLQHDLDQSSAQLEALRTKAGSEAGVVGTALRTGQVTVRLTAQALAPDAAAAVMYVPGTTDAWVVADRLPATPVGRGYELWYADAAGVHGLATVAFDGTGPFIAPLGVDLALGKAVMITLEDAGGATGDPGPQVVFGALQG